MSDGGANASRASEEAIENVVVERAIAASQVDGFLSVEKLAGGLLDGVVFTPTMLPKSADVGEQPVIWCKHHPDRGRYFVVYTSLAKLRASWKQKSADKVMVLSGARLLEQALALEISTFVFNANTDAPMAVDREQIEWMAAQLNSSQVRSAHLVPLEEPVAVRYRVAERPFDQRLIDLIARHVLSMPEVDRVHLCERSKEDGPWRQSVVVVPSAGNGQSIARRVRDMCMAVVPDAGIVFVVSHSGPAFEQLTADVPAVRPSGQAAPLEIEAAATTPTNPTETNPTETNAAETYAAETRTAEPHAEHGPVTPAQAAPVAPAEAPLSAPSSTQQSSAQQSSGRQSNAYQEADESGLPEPANDRLRNALRVYAGDPRPQARKAVRDAAFAGPMYVALAADADGRPNDAWRVGILDDGSRALAGFSSAEVFRKWRDGADPAGVGGYTLTMGALVLQQAIDHALPLAFDPGTAEELLLQPTELAVWAAPLDRTDAPDELPPSEWPTAIAVEPEPQTPEPESVTAAVTAIVKPRVDTLTTVPAIWDVVRPLLRNRPDEAWTTVSRLVEEGQADEIIRALSLLLWNQLLSEAQRTGRSGEELLSQAIQSWAAFADLVEGNNVRSANEMKELAEDRCMCGHIAAEHNPVWIAWEWGDVAAKTCAYPSCSCSQFRP